MFKARTQETEYPPCQAGPFPIKSTLSRSNDGSLWRLTLGDGEL